VTAATKYIITTQVQNNSTAPTVVTLQQANAEGKWLTLATDEVYATKDVSIEVTPNFSSPMRLSYSLRKGLATDNITVASINYIRVDKQASSRLVILCNTDADFSDDYRFGFNGQEKDNEIKGVGNSLDFGARTVDVRLGRTNAMDKYSYKFPGESPYSFVMNTPISAVDPDGKLIIFIGGLRLWERDKDQIRTHTEGAANGIYNSDVFNYWSIENNSFGEVADIAGGFMDRIGDENTWFASGSSGWTSQANERKKDGATKAEQFHAMVQSGEILLETNETIKIVSHSQGGAHAEGFAEQLLSYKDANGSPLYKIEVIYNITPHQPGGINAIQGIRNVQYSHPNDAVSSKAPLLMPNGKSKFAQINGVNEFDGRQILGGKGQPKATGALGNRNGHNVTDNMFIFEIAEGKEGYVAPRQDVPQPQPQDPCKE
jgi:RHS repeat-associated protein